MNSQQGDNREYLEAVHRMEEHLQNRIVKPWLLLDFIYFLTKDGKRLKNDLEILHGMSRRVISQRKQQILENNLEISDRRGKRLAFLDLLLELHLKDNSLSLEDIREEVDTIMYAGHDTTAYTMSWAFHLIGKKVK